MTFKSARYLEDGTLVLNPGDYTVNNGAIKSPITGKIYQLVELYSHRALTMMNKGAVKQRILPQSWIPPVFEVSDGHTDIFEKCFYKGIVIEPDCYKIVDTNPLSIEVDGTKIPLALISDSPDFDVLRLLHNGLWDYYYGYKEGNKCVFYTHEGERMEQTFDAKVDWHDLLKADADLASEKIKKERIQRKPREQKDIQVQAEPFDQDKVKQNLDPINPDYYKRFPFEVIDVTENFDFCRGNAIKYMMRAGQKPGNAAVQDLKKAVWYLNRALNHKDALPPTWSIVKEFPPLIGGAIAATMFGSPQALQDAISFLNRVVDESNN